MHQLDFLIKSVLTTLNYETKLLIPNAVTVCDVLYVTYL